MGTIVLTRDYFGWQAPVIDKDLAVPPASPVVGDRYLIASSPTGAWSTHTGHIATWSIPNPVSAPSIFDWMFSIPLEGWYVYVLDEDTRYKYNGTAWVIDAAIVNPATIDHDQLLGFVASEHLPISWNSTTKILTIETP